MFAEHAADAFKNGKDGPSSAPPSLEADICGICKHLYTLFAPEFVQAYPEAWIEIAYGHPHGKLDAAEIFSVFDLESAAEFAEKKNNDGYNVYVGAALRQGDQPPFGRATDTHVATASHVWIEYDGAGDDERISTNATERDLKPAFIVTTGTTPHPRRHLYLRVDGHATPDKIKAANTTLMEVFGSDNVQNPSRIMRLAGTINFPSPKKQERGYVAELVTFRATNNAPAYKIDDLIGLVAKSSSSDAPDDPQQDRAAPRNDDDLLALLEASRIEGRWHNSMLSAIATMVGRGWSDSAIKFTCAPYCEGKVFDADLIPFIDSARAKWDKPNREERAGAQPGIEPHPLLRELPQADDFPVDALEDTLAPVARAIHDITQAPMAICCQSVLAAAALTVQAYSNVDLPKQPSRPVSSFFVSVAASGERKTAVDSEALRPIRKRVRELRDTYDGLVSIYKNAKAAWEKARDEAKKKAGGDYVAIAAALNAIGPEPVAPLLPFLTCSEPTFEGLYKLLAEGQPSLGIFSDEGGAFIGSHGMNDESIKRTSTGLSNLWNGTEISRTRGGDGASSLSGRRLSIHLMCQPGIAAEMLSNAELLDQGFLSRFLVTAPETSAGSRSWREAAPASEATIKLYEEALLKILRRPLPLAAGRLNELEPPSIKLSAKARELWIDFYNWVDRESKPGGELATIVSLANKIPEHAGRLAAILALVADIEAREIAENQMEDGITLAQHYLAEALRLFEVGRVNGDLFLAQKLLDWLLAREGDLVSLPDVYQFGPISIRDKILAGKLVTILMDHGWLVRVEGGAEIDGKRRRDVYRVIRE
jgi:hypothetical protein